MSIYRKIRNLLFKPKRHQGSKFIGNNLSVLPDDTFLVSYPKSGNTWLRFLIANLVGKINADISFRNIEKIVPDIYRNSDNTLLGIAQPRVLKSHEMYQSHYPQVIYILRDPRDVAVSYYHHLIKVNRFPESMPIEDFIDGFIAGKFHQKFGTWKAHVNSWTTDNFPEENRLVIQYEALLSNPHTELKSIANFLGIQATFEKLQTAVENSQADRLRQLEIQDQWQPFEGNMRTDKSFVRAATAGNWKHELSQVSIEKIEVAWGDVMEKYGYLMP
jgi:hypothetical protein